MNARIERHRSFWAGQGPSLLLTSPDSGPLYETSDYRRRFLDPQRMWEAEMRRAEVLIGWPTDGIPTVRPNLGVVFIPSIAGQQFMVQDGQMPWPGAPIDMPALRSARATDLATTELMQRAAEFYAIHRQRGGNEIAAYLPDTQGVFDLAHMLLGDEMFMAMAGAENEQAEILEGLEICLDIYQRVTAHLKHLLGEPTSAMVHGHGTAQGIWFSNCGTRVSEDSATLLSPAMIDRFVMPFIQRAVAPFQGGFLHFCGLHKPFFERLCACESVRAIDLGNPEKYETRWLIERCASSNTVLYSRLPALDGESGVEYVRRIGAIVRATGARVVLRATVEPRDAAEASAMLAQWHELTA